MSKFEHPGPEKVTALGTKVFLKGINKVKGQR